MYGYSSGNFANSIHERLQWPRAPSLVPAYCIVLTIDTFSVSTVGVRGYSCELFSSHSVYIYRLYTMQVYLYL